MSSSYPPFGNVPAQLCQRCGRPLSPNEVTCGNCGQYNAAAPRSPSGMSWGGASSQFSQTAQQNGGQPWGQFPDQSHPFAGSSIPQRPVSPFENQPRNGNFFGGTGQQTGGSSPFGAAGQGINPTNFYDPSAPSQPFSSQPSSRPTSGSLEPMNSFQAPGFGQPPSQPLTAGFQPGSTGGFQTASFGQTPSQPLMGGSSPGNMYSSQTMANVQAPPQFPTAGFQVGSFQQGNMPGYQAPGISQPPEEKKRPRIGLLIGSLLLLLLIVGGGLGGYVLLKKNSPDPTAQHTATAAPTAIPKGAPLFKDAFTDNKNGWDTTSKAGQYSVKIGNGSMVLEDDNNRLLWELVPGARNFSDFLLTVDASLSKGTQSNGYGIYIRGASNQNADLATFYRFELYGDGTFAVFKGTVDAKGTSTSTPIVNFSTSSVVLKQGEVNHISISARGSTMTFSVNGTILKTFSDDSYTSGSIALFVSNLENTDPGAQATFSNLAIYPPQS